MSVMAVTNTLLAMLAGMILVSIANARGATAAMRLHRMVPAMATLVAFAGFALLVACSGSGGGTMPTGTPAGNYTVSVTVKAGTQTATTSVSVIVQQPHARQDEEFANTLLSASGWNLATPQSGRRVIGNLNPHHCITTSAP